MFEITVSYTKRFKLISKTIVMREETYDAAMEAFEEQMSKQHIGHNRIVNIKVVRIIHCLDCGRQLRLTRLVNECVCGKRYDSFGREIQKGKTAD